jgi:hypothetical protein
MPRRDGGDQQVGNKRSNVERKRKSKDEKSNLRRRDEEASLSLAVSR